MCGLAGIAGITNRNTRERLIWTLGMGIDERGGHAAGFVSVRETKVVQGRREGFWISAPDKFIERAAIGQTVLMHARYATCGKGGRHEAHPFEIVRNGRPVLWGAHNGVIWDAEESAMFHNRPYDVDSRE